ncbi:MAG: ubiquinone/menaquinone biosynthesis C-methylase UbiE [Planctomycetota bacterium]|jgi:ubiquinone/menaquinone biosynthesis C-methylase UbiE
MLIRLAVTALDKSPLLRRLLWRWWYGRLAKKFTQQSWTFMNYGYEPEAGAEVMPLDAEHEPDRLCVQLYEQVLSGVSLAGKDVVEVGSGRGGGASYLARTHGPSKFTGFDFSKGAVKLCQRTHADVANLEFIKGDAEDLPLADASCDVLLNVESSHCYGNVDKFFGEVARVLRPGGHFGFADFRTGAEMSEVAAMLDSLTGFRVLASVDITERVVAALTSDDARKRKLIEDIITPRLRHMFGEFAGLSGGRMFTSLQAREMVYHRFLLQKI